MLVAGLALSKQLTKQTLISFRCTSIKQLGVVTGVIGLTRQEIQKGLNY